MIINLPTSDALNTTTAKLYFRDWHGIVGMLHDFDQSYEGPASDWVEPILRRGRPQSVAKRGRGTSDVYVRF